MPRLLTRIHLCARRQWFLFVLLFIVRTKPIFAAADYDVRSGEWNGLQELVRIAQTTEVDLRPQSSLNWSEVRRGDGLLILYPQGEIDLSDLSAFLEDGGRLALLDDYGNSSALLAWFQVTRSEQIQGVSRTDQVPEVLVAYRRSEHPLTEGVDSLVTNAPVVLSHRQLSPVFSLQTDGTQGILLAGQVARGRLVLGGDPSVLINTMLRFPGNRQFARNLLWYLAAHSGGRVYLLHSNFTTRGTYPGRNARRHPLAVAVSNLDEALARLSGLAADPFSLRLLALILSVLGFGLFTARVWGPKPTDRFGPVGPTGSAASLHEKFSVFSTQNANMLYPALIAKRYFERRLLRESQLLPPTDVGEVLKALGKRLSEAQKAELRSLLVEFDRIATPGDEGGPSRIQVREFLSLWNRIGAILSALGEK